MLIIATSMKQIPIISVEKSAAATSRKQKNATHRILVVEDDNDLLQLSVNVLARSGYSVEAVKDGAAAWEAIQTKSYDLVITDNKMPRLTGVEMIEKVRGAGLPLPVIMATTYLPTHEFARKPWLEPEAMLQRPCSDEDLLATVKKILQTDDTRHGPEAENEDP